MCSNWIRISEILGETDHNINSLGQCNVALVQTNPKGSQTHSCGRQTCWLKVSDMYIVVSQRSRREIREKIREMNMKERGSQPGWECPFSRRNTNQTRPHHAPVPVGTRPVCGNNHDISTYPVAAIVVHPTSVCNSKRTRKNMQTSNTSDSIVYLE